MRTTDPEPILFIKKKLEHLDRIEAADIGCGGGRYDVRLFEQFGKRLWLTCIDDSEEIVAALKSFLESKHKVLTACNGFDGLQIFEQYENSIDLVITDLMMPELSGIGVISILKKKYPVIVRL